MKTKCFNKKTVIKNEQKICENCSETNCIKESFLNVIYNGTKYTKGQWYKETSNFVVFNENQIKLKNDAIKLKTKDLKEIFLKNRKRHTFLGNILPCIVFLFISLVILTALVFIQQSGNFSLIDKIENIRFYMWGISIFLLILSGILYYLTFIKNQQVVLMKKGSRTRYKIMSFNEFSKMLEIFDKNIEKEYDFFKTITTERLLIRELRYKDDLDFFLFGKNPNVTKYLMWKNYENISDAQEVIIKSIEDYKEGHFFRLAIALKDEKKVIGYIGLSKYDLSVSSCQIVYAIGEEYWGKGYTTEAVIGYVEYLKANNKTLIIAGHVEENTTSGKVLLKCGFKRDAKRDTKLNIHGEIKNIINYSIDLR